MEEKARELQITALKNGIVIDHIPSEKVFAIVELLKLKGYNEVVTVAINLKSTSLGKKGIIKIEDKVLDESELNKIALLSDHVTINIIENYKVVKKIQLAIPNEIVGLMKCGNNKCISNHENVETKFIKQLNEGLGYNGASLKKTTNFTVAAAYNPNVRDISKTKRLVEKKIKSGADYFITQPVFEEEKIVKLAELASNYPETPFFVGIMPITSYNNAIFLHNEVPGIKLSEEFLSRLEKVKDDKELCQKIALDESKKLIDTALKHFNGIYLITPFTRADLTVELIDYIETVKNK